MERQRHKAYGKLQSVVCPGGMNCAHHGYCTSTSKRTAKRIWNRTQRRLDARAIAAELREEVEANG